MAADGPVTPTQDEITVQEFRFIYVLATGKPVTHSEYTILGMPAPLSPKDEEAHRRDAQVDDYVPLPRGEYIGLKRKD